MPPGPRRLPLAEKLWLFQRTERARELAEDSPSGRALGRMMSIESLEHRVRNRVRMFLRHTWLVAILGTLALGGLVAAGVYYTQEREHLRIAAGPLDARFVGVLSDQIATSTVTCICSWSRPTASKALRRPWPKARPISPSCRAISTTR